MPSPTAKNALSAAQIAGTPSLNRRSVSRALAASLAAPALVLRPAHAAEITIRLGNNVPVSHPINVRTREAVEKIKRATGGRVEFRVFPNNQLGGDADMLSQTRSGALDMYTIPGAFAITVIPDVGIHGVAFAFKDYASVWRAMDGPLGTLERKEFRKIGMHALDTSWDNGFRQLTSRDKQIRTPDDLIGFKVRTPTTTLITSIFEGLGASPTSVNIKETYAALQTRLADGQENPLPIIDTFKFFEVQKYCALTNHVWDGFLMTANLAFWDKLPADVRPVIEAHFNEAGRQQRADILKLEEGLQTSLEKKGISFAKVDQQPFREKLKKSGYYSTFRKGVSAEGFALLEQQVGTLG